MLGRRKWAALGMPLVMLGAAIPVAAQHSEIVITAKPEADVLRRVVPIGDLDLQKEAGRKKMEQRVSVAVHQVCPETLETLKGKVMVRQCRMEAWAGARPQMAQAIERASGRMATD